MLQQLEIISLLRQLVQMQSSKKIPFPPLPEIETALSRLREIKREEHRGRLLSLLERAHAQWAADHPDESG